MKKQRIPETDQGITGELVVSDFDKFQKKLRDRGLIETDDIIKSGINTGEALEIGPGPGYLGLEWLKKTNNTNLHWIEISEDMKKIALKNAKEYSFTDRVKITVSDATNKFPFRDNYFDAVFTNGSMHEWTNPVGVFNEVYRVLKKGGKFFISDLKRNLNPILLFIMKFTTNKKSMKQGLVTSVNASYLKNELIQILSKSNLKNFIVNENPFGLIITGTKE